MYVVRSNLQQERGTYHDRFPYYIVIEFRLGVRVNLLSESEN